MLVTNMIPIVVVAIPIIVVALVLSCQWMRTPRELHMNVASSELEKILEASRREAVDHGHKETSTGENHRRRSCVDAQK